MQRWNADERPSLRFPSPLGPVLYLFRFQTSANSPFLGGQWGAATRGSGYELGQDIKQCCKAKNLGCFW
jgi:hypothetical protein